MKTSIRLTLSQKYELADHLAATSSQKLSKRLLTISLRHYGYSISEISNIQDVSDRTVRTWIMLFKEGGFEKLLELKYESSRNSRLNPYLEHIRQWKAQHPGATLEELQAFLIKSYEVEIEYSWLYRFLKKRGLW